MLLSNTNLKFTLKVFSLMFIMIVGANFSTKRAKNHHPGLDTTKKKNKIELVQVQKNNTKTN